MKKLSSAAIHSTARSGRTSAIQECAPDSIRGAVVPPSAPHPLCKETSRFKIQDLKPQPSHFNYFKVPANGGDLRQWPITPHGDSLSCPYGNSGDRIWVIEFRRINK